MNMINELAWEKMNGLLPVIVQDSNTRCVLMLGYMNRDALQQTLDTKWVTFFSRSKQALWVKGESSGNKLALVNIFPDCDGDTLLIFATPTGPTCHKLTATCFAEIEKSNWQIINYLEKLIDKRYLSRHSKSYTSSLFDAGLSRIAQKVGEEGVEVVLAAIEKKDDEFSAEVADLIYHLLVLLRAKNLSIANVLNVLVERSKL